MSRRARGRRWGVAVAAGLALALAPVPASGGTTPTLAPVTTYEQPTNVPGDVACVATGFCMGLFYSSDFVTSDATVSALRSLDGGATWSRVAPPLVAGATPLGATSYDQSIQCVAAGTCFFVGRGVVLRTVDAGATWQRLLGLGWAHSASLGCVSTGACVDLRPSGPGLRTFWLAPGASRFVEGGAAPLGHFTLDGLSCATPRRCVAVGEDETLRSSTTNVGLSFVTSNLGPSARWREVRPTPDRWLTALSCPTTAFCMGIEGAVPAPDAFPVTRIARSVDGGVTWTVVADGDGHYLAAQHAYEPMQSTVQCASATVCTTSIGYAAIGGPTIIRTKLTVDGGASWQTHQLASLGDAFPFGYSACASVQRCIVDAGSTGPIVSGGRIEAWDGSRWKEATPPGDATAATGLVCTSGSTCYRIDTFERASGFGGRLLASGDDGSTWHVVALPSGVQPDVLGGCQDASTCELFALKGATWFQGLLGQDDLSSSSVVELSTTDGGTTWLQTPVAGAETMPIKATCTSTSHCVLEVNLYSPFGNVGELLDRSGTAWLETRVPLAIGASDVLFAAIDPVSLSCSTAGDCLVANVENNRLRLFDASTNGGATWSPVAPPGGPSMLVTAIACVGASTCDVTYQDPAAAIVPGSVSSHLVQTTDAGATWSTPLPLTFAPSQSMAQLACTDPLHCLVVADAYGEVAVAAQTADAGATWTQVGWGAAGLPGKLGGTSAGGWLTCSPTTCLTEAESVANQPLGETVTTFQVLHLR